MTFILIVGALIVLGCLGFAVALARRGKETADDNLALAPGLATKAPRDWAGAHTPEAKLHRRLRAAARSIAEAPTDTAGSLDQRVAVEQQIVAVDEQLVAVAAIPEAQRAEPLAEVEALVTAIESSTARVLSAGVDTGWLSQTQSQVDRKIADQNPAVSPAVAPALPPEQAEETG